MVEHRSGRYHRISVVSGPGLFDHSSNWRCGLDRSKHRGRIGYRIHDSARSSVRNVCRLDQRCFRHWVFLRSRSGSKYFWKRGIPFAPPSVRPAHPFGTGDQFHHAALRTASIRHERRGATRYHHARNLPVRLPLHGLFDAVGAAADRFSGARALVDEIMTGRILIALWLHRLCRASRANPAAQFWQVGHRSYA